MVEAAEHMPGAAGCMAAVAAVAVGAEGIAVAAGRTAVVAVIAEGCSRAEGCNWYTSMASYFDPTYCYSTGQCWQNIKQNFLT